MKFITKSLVIALFALTLVPFSACKKGANDPSISLRSRTGRLTGVWKLSGYDQTKTTVTGSSFKTTTNVVTSYDGTFKTEVTTVTLGNGTPNKSTDKVTYSCTWTVNKDHTFKMEVVEDGQTDVIEGTWAWIEGNGAELKKKEAIQIFITKETFGGSAYTVTGFNNGSTVVLSRLANDEIQIDMSETSNSTNYTETVTGTQTFKQ